MTIAQRFLLTLFIVLVILFALAALGYFTGNWNEDESARPGYGYGLASAQTQIVTCVDPATREKVRAVALDALDDALKEHIRHMFEVWMKDDRGQPERARNGVNNGVAAYVKASKAAGEWMPLTCP